MRVLILGGTTEASAIARTLAGDARFDAVLSLAGRTAAPAAQPIRVRTGGFGGAQGLAGYLRSERIGALIDATHPFAARMKVNAAQAAALTRVPRLAVLRPEWRPATGDRWRQVASMEEAAAALGTAPRRVFLAIGRQELAPFGPPHAYLVRSVDPPDPATLPQGARVVLARGPFDEAAETDLLRAHAIEIVVAKNAGGAATEAKLSAARRQGLTVVMVRRPPPPAPPIVPDAEAAVAWLAAHAVTGEAERGA
ncbi:MAG: cobalt-precorrin-6A reductase [Proteobacteria bacterium]|nr:cobalt-precorrin-6A reductase [Pseudomonadota bacterium]